MYHDEIFEKAILDAKEESFVALKEEVSAMEHAIEKFLTNALECTSSILERDYSFLGI